MNTRKTILSAMSVMTSLMMFAAGSSDAKGENDNREQNQAIVGEVKKMTAPFYAQKAAEDQAAAEAEWQKFPKNYNVPKDYRLTEDSEWQEPSETDNAPKEKPKSKGMPLSIYVLCGLAAMVSGMVTGSIGTKVSLDLRRKREDRSC